MTKQGVGQSRNVLSPITDESSESESKSWAVTQQHGKSMISKTPSKQGRRQDTRQKQGDGKGKKEGESNKIKLPVLGSLSMNIETHNPYEAEKKSNHEALYKSRLLRTKKQKSIEGMFQAAKANKELSQILLNMNPSFNLDIGEHNLHRFLAPNRHLLPEDVDDSDCYPEPHTPTQLSTEEPDDITTLAPLPAPIKKEEYPLLGLKPQAPPPLTAHELVRRSKVIEAVAPSSLWVPASSLKAGELVSI